MKKRVLILAAALSVILVLCSCSAGRDAGSPLYGANASGGSDGYGYDSIAPLSAEVNLDYMSAAQADRQPQHPGGLKIIYTAYVHMQTKEFQDSYSALMSLVDSCGGYIQHSNLRGGYTSENGYYNNLYADFSARIPSGNYKAFLSSAGELATITDMSEDTVDITSQYVDTEARLNSLKVQEKRLLELLENAEIISDVIEIESKLSDVRYQIESYQSMINTYDNLTDYSTVYIYLGEVSSIIVPRDTFVQRVMAALRGSVQTVIIFLDRALISLIYILPFSLIALVLYLVVRKATAKKRQRRKERLEAVRKQQNTQPLPFENNPFASSGTDKPE